MNRIIYARANLNTLQQFIYLFVRHLLPELGEDVSKFSSTDEPVAFFIEYLETPDELLCCRQGSRTRESR